MEIFEKERAYWTQKLQHEDRIACIPYCRTAKPVDPAAAYAALRIPLAASTAAAIHALAKGNAMAMFMVLTAGVEALLHKHTAEEQLVLGVPVFSLSKMNDRRLNPLVFLKQKVDGASSLKSLLDDLKPAIKEAAAHQTTPFWQYLDLLQAQREENGLPLIHTIVALKQIHELSFMEHASADAVFHFDAQQEHMAVELLYRPEKYEAGQMARLIAQLEQLLAAMLASPALPLAEIGMMSEREREQVLYAFNRTETAYADQKTIQLLIEEQAERTPDHVAIICGDQSLTYRQLNEEANRLARRLSAKGAGRDSLVGLLLQRTVSLIPAMLGVLKAGAAYCPIDPAFPQERTRTILEDSGIRLLLADSATLETQRDAIKGLDIVELEQALHEPVSPENVPSVNAAGDLAYVIYTSGSTGKPKGVMIEHRSVLNFIAGIVQAIPVVPGQRILSVTTYSFDIFVLESWLALSQGAVVLLATEEEQADPALLGSLITRQGAEWAQTTPSRMQMLLQHPDSAAALAGLTHVLLGGEELPASLLGQLRRHTQARLFNLYGPTETTVWSTLQELAGTEQTVSIGKPIANTQIYIMKDYGGRMEPAPTGMLGELCIAGDGLARGYWNRPELSAEKFVPHPLEPGKRMYRTGDLAKWRPDGTLEYAGRVDHQVKIRGYRIELGEIEAQLLHVQSIQEAVVTACEDQEGIKYLCAYVVAEQPYSPEAIKASLAAALPSYMVPSYFVQLERMPLNTNGKIDRKQLPAPGAAALPGSAYTAPRTPLEAKLAVIWQDILKLEKVGVTDNFFELGGHSLRVTTLVSRLQKELKADLSLREVFRLATIEEMARAIGERERLAFGSIPRAEEQPHYPLSSAQTRMYLLHQLEGAKSSYNIPGIRLIYGKWEAERAEQAIRLLIERHEQLRTSFHLEAGEPVQTVHPHVSFELVCREADEARLDEEIAAFIRPFELKQAPLFRFEVLRLAEDVHAMLFDFHHIVVDAISMNLLFEDFLAFYAGRELPAAELQYKDYAVWQKSWRSSEEYERQRLYWLDVMQGELPVLELPLDFDRPKQRAFAGHTKRYAMDGELTRQLAAFSRASGMTMNTLLLALYAVLLHKYTEQTDLIIGSTVAGRQHADLERTVGNFINFVPLRVQLRPEEPVGQFVRRQVDNLLQAYENQHFPFEDLIAELPVKSAPSRNPLYDTMLIFHNQATDFTAQAGDEFKLLPYEVETEAVTLDIKLDVTFAGEEQQGLLVAVQYNRDLFAESSIDGFMAHFFELLRQAMANEEQTIAEIACFDSDTGDSLRRKRERTTLPGAAEELSVFITATFTAEPVEPFVKKWCDACGLEARISFAGYNQVFQQLLDSQSALSANPGINVLLIRFEDWIRGDMSGDEAKMRKLELIFGQLAAALEQYRGPAPYLAGIFPPSPALGLSEQLAACIGQLNERWLQLLEQQPKAVPLDLRSVASDYEIADVFDAVTDQKGHLPFSDAYYAAVGTEIARHAAAQQRPPFKVVVLDCDNTLWRGVCAEDGALGVAVEPAYEALQRFVLRLRDEGMLLALSSKNEEQDVWETFERNPGMVLRKEHLTAWRISWEEKPESLRQLAEELRLGLDSFIFIDDNPLECSKMMEHCPEVLTLQLPQQAGHIGHWLKHIWAFDQAGVASVTEEDRKRTAMYAVEKQRQELQNSGLTLEHFFRQLELRVSMRPLAPESLARAAQLTQRTNQFNLSTIRRTADELELLLRSEGCRGWVVEASDRFGAYGIVGLVIVTIEPGHAAIDTLLLSCRVLGRGVEDAMLACLQTFCQEQGLDALHAEYRPTAKNKPVLDFLLRTGWEARHAAAGRTEYAIAAACPNIPEHIRLYWGEPLPEGEEQPAFEGPVRGLAVKQERPEQGEPLQPSGRVRFEDEAAWSELARTEGPHRLYYEALLYSTGERLLGMQLCSGSAVEAEIVQPAHELERKLLEVWQRVLGKDTFGVTDNFFELGGHSLLALKMEVELEKLGFEVDELDIYKCGTVREMAACLNQACAVR